MWQLETSFSSSMSQHSTGEVMPSHSMDTVILTLSGPIEEYRGICAPSIHSTLITVVNDNEAERVWQNSGILHSPEVQSTDRQSTLSVGKSSCKTTKSTKRVLVLINQTSHLIR